MEQSRKKFPVSYELAMNILNRCPASRPGHVVYCTHEALRDRVRETTGLSLEDAWECDLIWNTDDGPVPWSQLGRVTDMGHAEFMAGGADRRNPGICPFRRLEEARAFDAVAEYGLPDETALTAYYEAVCQNGQRAYPSQVFTGGYYKTLLSGALEIFGWDMLLQLAADRTAFEAVLDPVFQLSLHHYRCWARTGVKAFILHDDMVWSGGPFLDPDFYRGVIFPRYTALVRLLHDAGKKVLFASDGNWASFMEDVAATGADGFIFESAVPLAAMADRFGNSHVLVGSAVDCRTLTFGTRDEIRAEIDLTLKAAQRCRGLFIAVGNHIPSNVPLENALFYAEYLRRQWRNSHAL